MAFFKGYAVGRRRYDDELGGFIKASNLEWGRKLERSTRGRRGKGAAHLSDNRARFQLAALTGEHPRLHYGEKAGGRLLARVLALSW